ncbi:heavy metal translocating P-type ATPase [Athalassotoga saccharophila]|uniref:heavy metal translocating P-type ATPase n=1 Tax=Athalassotoga saccharophila TaxID=1441386 RepID=UPI0018D9ADBC|nr:heavy metal translocating P-type ATPase [Athalassotoga saccharophila]BBJ28464.1 copper-exporting P-type ATPase [Athalassotoga saccharophila]
MQEKEVKLDIEGMTCASCVKAVEKSISKLEGVSFVSVNLMDEKAIVKFDPAVVKVKDMEKNVKKAGYGATLILDDDYDRDEMKRKKTVRTFRNRFIFSAIFASPLLFISMAHTFGLTLPAIISPDLSPLNFALVQILLVIPIIIFGRNFYIKGIPLLFKGEPNMDTLVGLGTGAAIIYSLFSTVEIILGHPKYVSGLYFDTAGVIVTLISLGKYLENLSKSRTSTAIKKLMSLKPKTAILKSGNTQKEIPVDEVEVGDILIVKAGMIVPVDGVVLSGNASIDQSMLTGEPIPIDASKGTHVSAGSINLDGMIEIEAQKVGKDTVISKIIKLIRDAQSSKAPIARLADIVSGYFVPIVIGIAALTFVVWLLIGMGFIFALTMSIAVLVIACPCALGLATPTAIMVGSGKAAENGILFKSGEALETLRKVKIFVFDKTGTITYGKPKVVDIVPINYDRDEFFKIAASMSSKSSHPLDKAISNEYKSELFDVEDFQVIAGKGITGIIKGKRVRMGNAKFIEYGGELSVKDGETPVFVEYDGKVIGFIGISDEINPTAVKAIKKLKQIGNVYMLTGDNVKMAQVIAKQVGIDDFFAEILPDQKAQIIEQLKKNGIKVAMIGDGINDSVALAKADVGIAVASGTDIAMESADIVLMKNDLEDIVKAIELSNATIKNVKENLFWAFFYNIIGIPIAAGVLYMPFGISLNPMIAALAMAFSSVTVVTNAIRLKGN